MCEITLESREVPGHTHTCSRAPHPGDHVCDDPKCRRWYGLAGT